MKNPLLKGIALRKMLHLFVTKLTQHPNYYNIRHYRKAGRTRNPQKYYLWWQANCGKYDNKIL